MLQVRNLNVSYGHAQVIHDVSLTVEEGKIAALVGSNGAGKTTLTRTIAGLLRPTSGEISFVGERIDGKTPKSIVEKGLVLVREGRGIFTNLTVEENLRMGAYSARARKSMKESLSNVLNLFPLLAQRKKQQGGTLSGGEQQMLAIGRAMMSLPKLLILDEPSLGLAPIVVDKMFESLLEINKTGVTLFVVDQNLRYTLEHADAAYVMEMGRMTLTGSGKALMDRDEVKGSYLGL